MEQWREIDGFDGVYEISSQGNVKSFARNSIGKIIRPVNLCGYLRIGLWKNKIKHSILIHRLVAIAFIPNPENKPEVNHINGKKWDNRVENLEWCTRRENVQHAFNTNLRTGYLGEKHPTTKLKDDDVINIRKRKQNGEYSKQVHKDYKNKIQFRSFNNIWYNQCWKHLLGGSYD